MSQLQANPSPVDILLVEDSEDDVYIAKHAFKKGVPEHDMVIHVARDGVEALHFLKKEPPFEQAPRPTLILLDLNMPRMDGRELLAIVKNDPALRCIPVIVLTTSDWDSDIAHAYNSHANSYMIKPVDLHIFVGQVSIFRDYWLNLIELPSIAGAHVAETAFARRNPACEQLDRSP